VITGPLFRVRPPPVQAHGRAEVQSSRLPDCCVAGADHFSINGIPAADDKHVRPIAASFIVRL
jgi:hypothetical protein